MNEVAVKLHLPDSIRLHPVVHVSQVKPYVAEQRWGARGKPPPPLVDNDGHVSYLVEGILGHKRVMVRQGKGTKPAYKYLVKWLGYPIWDCSWEPESSFPSDSSILPVYKAQHGL